MGEARITRVLLRQERGIRRNEQSLGADHKRSVTGNINGQVNIIEQAIPGKRKHENTTYKTRPFSDHEPFVRGLL